MSLTDYNERNRAPFELKYSSIGIQLFWFARLSAVSECPQVKPFAKEIFELFSRPSIYL